MVIRRQKRSTRTHQVRPNLRINGLNQHRPRPQLRTMTNFFRTILVRIPGPSNFRFVPRLQLRLLRHIPRRNQNQLTHSYHPPSYPFSRVLQGHSQSSRFRHVHNPYPNDFQLHLDFTTLQLHLHLLIEHFLIPNIEYDLNLYILDIQRFKRQKQTYIHSNHDLTLPIHII